jgi:hypothetical protein
MPFGAHGEASQPMRAAARKALIDLWCRDGFRVPSRHNRLVLTLVELAGLPDEIRKRLGAVSDHEAEWRARQGL